MLKAVLFTFIIIYASWYDIKHLIVPTHVHILLLVTGLLDVGLSSFMGFAISFFPLFVISLAVNSMREDGVCGGDIKFAGMCGFVMQGFGGMISTTIGLTLALIIVPIERKIYKKTDAPFALVPYISAGCLITYVLGGI